MVARQGPVRFEIVCTGNICRSPFVHVLLSRGLDEVAPGEFEVHSSGTHALAGTPPERETRALVRGHGLSLTGYRASQITPIRLQRADLILVMDKEQRQHVIDEFAGAVRRTFLLKEFARLLATLDDERSWEARLARTDGSTRARWREIGHVLAAERERRRAEGETDILGDPFRQGRAAFTVMAQEAEAAVARIVSVERRLRNGSVPS